MHSILRNKMALLLRPCISLPAGIGLRTIVLAGAVRVPEGIDPGQFPLAAVVFK